MLALLFAGAAGLGCELLWLRVLSIVIGSETLAVWGILFGFMAGLGLGTWLFGRLAYKLKNPVKLFFVLELTIAGIAAISPFAIHLLMRHHSLGFGGTDQSQIQMVLSTMLIAGLVLLPGTLCMGGALPLLVEARRRWATPVEDGRGVGRLYAANTFGAVVGISVSTYVLLPAMGLSWGGVAIGAFAVVAALLVLPWMKDLPPKARVLADPGNSTSWIAFLLLIVTGAAGIGLEVTGLRILGQCMQNTVYTFANILIVYLLGTSLGAWLYQRQAGRVTTTNSHSITAMFCLLLTGAVFLAGYMMHFAPGIMSRISPEGAPYILHLLAEFVVAVSVFAMPTVLMGALFTHLVAPFAPSCFGRANALNMIGAAMAPFLFGAWAIARLGYREAFCMSAYLYIGAFFLLAAFGRVKRAPLWCLCLAVLMCRVIVPTSMSLMADRDGWSVLKRYETVYGAVVVTEFNDYGYRERRLQVDQHFMMGGGPGFADQRLGHLPFILASHPQRALFLGVGTGATLSAIRSYPLEHVDAVELVPEVIDVMHYFEDGNRTIDKRENVQFHVCDARRFVMAATGKYDVVVGDLFHPARDGASHLFSLEHFEALDGILSDGGLFAQWLPLYQFDEATTRSVVRTFVEVFSEAYCFLGIYNADVPSMMLLGRASSGDGKLLQLDPEWMTESFQNGASYAFESFSDILGSYMMDREGLLAYAGESRRNTDMMPRILFDAPRAIYEGGPAIKYSSLESLLPYRKTWPDQLIANIPGEHIDAFKEHAEAYRTAVGLYLEGDILRVKQGQVSQDTLKLWLGAYRTQPDFSAVRGALHRAVQEKPDCAEFVHSGMMLARE